MIWLHRKTGMRPLGSHFSSHFSQDRWEIILIFLAHKSVYGTLVEDPASHSSKPVSKSAWMSGRKNTHWAVISNPTESQAGTAKPNTTHWKKKKKNRWKSHANSVSSDSTDWSSAEIGARLKQLFQTTWVKLSLQKNKGVCGRKKKGWEQMNLVGRPTG